MFRKETQMATRTVVFIHGNFVNYECWNQWVRRYEAKGYTCIAIAYPNRDKPVEVLRKAHPDFKAGELTLEQNIDHHVRTIKALPEAPIIIGHSFGGLLTQLMLNRGLGAAAIAIDSVPPQGVLTSKLSFFRSLAPLLNPLYPVSRPWLMPFKHFQYTFANGMSLNEQRRAYDESVVPESVRLSRGGLSSAARVDFAKPHAPLLMIGGELDHIMPSALNKTNFKRYAASSPSISEFKEFAGRNHYSVIGGKGWEDVADYVLQWAEAQTASTRKPHEALQPVGAI
jgi:pimeloyl-ACP methyl ester carboxylesterase